MTRKTVTRHSPEVRGRAVRMARRLMPERQAIGIEAARAKGRYKARKPKVPEKAPKMICLAEEGLTKREIGDRLGCSIRSVLAVLADSKQGDAAA